MGYYCGNFPNGTIDDVRPMRWTTEPPTKQGYYWVHFVDEFPQPIIAFFMKDDNGKWYADIDDEKYDLRAFTHWLGPLPVPEPPQVQNGQSPT